jgi:hypothetical protein
MSQPREISRIDETCRPPNGRTILPPKALASKPQIEQVFHDYYYQEFVRAAIHKDSHA